MQKRTGSCLCGDISYEIQGELRSVVACHCHQCRKTSGHYVAATQALQANVVISGSTLKWFQSSEAAERGFCDICGSNLFWRRHGNPYISIGAGTIDGPTGLKIESQIHAESAGDYYDLPHVPVIDQSQLS